MTSGLSTFPDLCSLETRVADYFALTEINCVFMDGRWTEDAFPTTYLLYPRVNSFVEAVIALCTLFRQNGLGRHESSLFASQ